MENNNLKIFTSNIEQKACDQINTLMSQSAFEDCKVRIMPDVHAGAGCVIGFTADMVDKVIPNIVGVDIGCGMLTVELGYVDIDFLQLDLYIRGNIPNGFDQNKTQQDFSDKLEKDIREVCGRLEIDDLRQRLGVGSLGGGNHFIEVNIDDVGCKYLVIHSGSRNFGLQVAKYHQTKAEEYVKNIKNELCNLKNKEIGLLKQRKAKIALQGAIDVYNEAIKDYNVPKELSFLEGEKKEAYLKDMEVCMQFAKESREIMASKITSFLGLDFRKLNYFQTVHNYIDLESNIVRKGAVSAKKGEKLLIPINMRDGSLICIGKGNDDWNQSAPHGAGRIMSRTQAKETVSMEEYTKSMDGIFTTTVQQSTIDESPMAYKPIQEIIDNIQETVEIVKVIKPIYNFKAY